MSDRRRFTVTAPDWGPAHLSSDAVVAFVDDELAHGPHARATAHVAACPECAAEVVAQRQARTALQGASCPSLPTSLLSSLRAIPQDTELPAPPAGLAMSADGQLGSVLRAEAVATHGRRPPTSRLLKFGTGAAMSGIAIGAIALGVTALPAPVVPAPTGGALLNAGPTVPARLGVDGGTRAAEDVEPRLSARATPRSFLRQGLR